MKKTVSFTKHATNVFLHILTRCNLRCRYCYINKKQHGSRRLDLETMQKWLKPFANKDSQANVIFLGGEPTLHPDLPAAITKARELGYGSVTVDSNGYLFNDILCRVTPAEVDYFSFSLDGASAVTNDRIRGSGSFEKCVQGIQKTAAKGFNTSLIYTVSRMNIHELPQMIPIIAKLKLNRFFIQIIGVRGKAAEIEHYNPRASGLQVSRSEWQGIIPEVAEKVARAGVMVTYPKVYLDPDEPFECAGLVAKNYFIFPNGRVYRCPICEDYPIHSQRFEKDKLVDTDKINEIDMFKLTIPEGCVMNRIIQPKNLAYNSDGTPQYKIACCMLKEEVQA